jgi:hypothetical protein
MYLILQSWPSSPSSPYDELEAAAAIGLSEVEAGDGDAFTASILVELKFD